MSVEELSAIQKAYFNDFKNSWEQTRTLAHTVVASQSTKPVDAQKMMPFSWDKESVNKKETTLSDFERIKNKLK